MLSHGWQSEVYSSPYNTKMLGCTSSTANSFMRTKGKLEKRRGKTRGLVRRRSSKGCYNNIVKELMIEDTAGYKEMMRMNHGNFWIRWTLRVRGLNMLSVAVQIHSTLLSHTWMTAKQRKCWAVLRKKFDQFQIWLNTAQQLSTGFSDALNMLRACTVDKSSAFARGLRHTTNFCFFALRLGFLGSTNKMDITGQIFLKLIGFVKPCLEVKAIKKNKNSFEMIMIKPL